MGPFGPIHQVIDPNTPLNQEACIPRVNFVLGFSELRKHTSLDTPPLKSSSTLPQTNTIRTEMRGHWPRRTGQHICTQCVCMGIAPIQTRLHPKRTDVQFRTREKLRRLQTTRNPMPTKLQRDIRSNHPSGTSYMAPARTERPSPPGRSSGSLIATSTNEEPEPSALPIDMAPRPTGPPTGPTCRSTAGGSSSPPTNTGGVVDPLPPDLPGDLDLLARSPNPSARGERSPGGRCSGLPCGVKKRSERTRTGEEPPPGAWRTKNSESTISTNAPSVSGIPMAIATTHRPSICDTQAANPTDHQRYRKAVPGAAPSL